MKNQFVKLELYSDEAEQVSTLQSRQILVNINCIVSIKPINISHPTKTLSAYWVRLTNGKKYKALSIPRELSELLDDQVILDINDINESNDSAETSTQQFH